MNFEEALALLEKTKPAPREPKAEKSKTLLMESRDLGYGDAISIIEAIEKVKLLTGSYAGESPKPTKLESKIIESKAQEKKDRGKLGERKADFVEGTGIEEKPQQKESPSKLAGSTYSFKKETDIIGKQVVEIKPLLGLEIPTPEEAREVAKERAEKLKSPQPADKAFLSKKLLLLTQQLLKEKDANRRRNIKIEMEHVKKQLKGEASNIEEEVRKIMEEDVEKAVDEIKAALKIYEGIEDRKKIEEELRKAVLTYESYLEELHNSMLYELGLEVPKPSYTKLRELMGSSLQPKEEGPSREGEIKGIVQQEKAPASGAGLVSPPPKFEEIRPEIEGEKEEPTAPEGQGVLAGSTEEKPSKSGSNEAGIIEEIKNMREGKLLHELGALDRKSFTSYLRGELSKEEALKKARVLLAISKGMPEDRAKEVFG